MSPRLRQYLLFNPVLSVLVLLMISRSDITGSLVHATLSMIISNKVTHTSITTHREIYDTYVGAYLNQGSPEWSRWTTFDIWRAFLLLFPILYFPTLHMISRWIAIYHSDTSGRQRALRASGTGFLAITSRPYVTFRINASAGYCVYEAEIGTHAHIYI